MSRAGVREALLALLAGALALGLFHAVAHGSNPEFAGRPQWDEGHYVSIALHGYARGEDFLRDSNVAFAPGYPLLLRAAAAATGMDPAPCRLLLSGMLFTCAALLAQALFATALATAARRRALAALLTAPGAFFAMAGYAEALALPLALAFFLALARGRRLLACGFAAAALFARQPAIVLPLALAVLTVVDAAASDTPREAARKLLRLAVVELPLCSLGLIAHVAVLHAEVGDGFAFLEAYRAWNRLEPAAPALLPAVGPAVILPEAGRIPSLWVALAAFYLVPVLLIAQRRALPLAWFAYGAIAWLFFLANENPWRLPLGNWIRWLAPLFPIGVALAAWADGGRPWRRAAFWFGVALQAGIGAWLAHRFARGEWAS